MITCSRCGKENQDLYKFCLGCGAKLQAGGGAPAPKPALPVESFIPTPPPDVLAPPATVPKTEIPPDPEIFMATGPTAKPPLSPQPGPRANAPFDLGAGGHLGLSVQQPIQLTPTPAAVGLGPTPRVPASGMPSTGPSVQIGIGSIPMQVPVRPSPAAVPAGNLPFGQPVATPMAPAAVPVVQAPLAPSFSPPPTDTVTCPTCGKQVAATFAFCGGCGHRLKPVPGAVGEAAVQRAEAVAPVRVAPRGHLTLIRPDGTEGGAFALQEGQNVVGRGHGPLFDSDPYLSPRHAEFVLSEGHLDVRDLHSLNGVFVRITEEEVIESGDTFRIGQELLRFDVIHPVAPLEDGTEIIGTPNPGYWGRLSVVVGRDLDGPAFPLFDEIARLGRERGDILFPEDGYVSGSHCHLSVREGRVYLKDLGSSNGTFLRVRDSRVVPSGSLLLMGQQLFRVAYK